MFSTGEFIASENGFDQKNWGIRTTTYLGRIKKIKMPRWEGIINAVRASMKVAKRTAAIRRGPSPVEDELEYALPDSDPV